MDCSAGKVSIKKGKTILEGYGIDVDFNIFNTDVVVKDVKSENETLEINMKLSVDKEDNKCIEEVESFNRVTRGETIGPAVLSARYLSSVRGRIQGIDVPLFSGELQSMHIVSLPEESFNCDMVSITKNISIKGEFSRYRLKDGIIIILETSLFKLSCTFKLINADILESNKSTMNINIENGKESYEEEIKTTQIVIDWLTGKDVRVYRQDNYRWNIPLPRGKDKDINEFVKELKIRNRIFKNIVNVRRYFGVDFKNLKSISRDEDELLERLNEIGRTRKLRLESIYLKLSDITFSEEASTDTLRKESIFLLESKKSDNIEVELFGEKIILGSSRIKCKDAYISNYDEVKNNVDDKLIIKSKRNKLFIEYCLA